MSYAICFDFPEAEGMPYFGCGDKQPGITTSLDYAKKFESEEIAARFLANVWGPHMRQFGSVVEVED